MSDDLASAYVAIRPNLDTFEEELEAGVDEAMESVEAVVNVTADTGEAQAAIDELEAPGNKTIVVDVVGDEGGSAFGADLTDPLAALDAQAADTEVAFDDLTASTATFGEQLSQLRPEYQGVFDASDALADQLTGALAPALDDAAISAALGGPTLMDLAGASDAVAAAAGGAADDVEVLGGRFVTAGSNGEILRLSVNNVIASLIEQGLVAQNAGDDLLDLDGNVTNAAVTLKNFGVVLDDGAISTVGLDQTLQKWASGGLNDAILGVRDLTPDLVAAAQAGYGLETGLGALGATADEVAAAVKDAAAGVDELLEEETAYGGGLARFIDQSNAAGAALKDFGSDASGMVLTLGSLAPGIAAVGTEAIGAMLALAGAASIGAAGIGAFAVAAIGDLGGIESAVENSYQSWYQLNDVIAIIAPAVEGLGGMVTSVLDDITPLIQPAVSAFMQLEEQIEAVGASPEFKQFIAWLGSAFGSTEETFVTTMENFASALGEMLEASAPFITMVENGMVSLSADLDKFAESNGFKEFISWLQQNGPEIGQIVSNLAGLVESLWEGFTQVGGALGPVVEGLTKFADAVSHIPGFDDLVAGTLTLYFGLSAISGVAGAVVSGIGKIADAFKGLAVEEGIADSLDPAAWILALAVAAGVAGYEIGAHFDDIKHFFDDLGDDVKDWADDFGRDFDDALQDVEGWANDVTGALGQFVHDLEQWASDLVNDITAPFRDLVSKMETLGENIIEGLLHGLERAWDDVIGWLEDAVKDVVDVFKDILGIFSPSTVMAELGEQTMEGFGLGLQTGWTAHVASVLADSAALIAASFGGTVETAFGSGLATAVAPSAAASTALNTTAGVTVHSPTTITIQAPGADAPTIAAAVKQAMDQHDRQLVTKIFAGSRGH